MIRKKRAPVKYEVAECDGCKRDLRQDDGGGIENVNHGTLKADFGWPSPLDEVGGGPEYHLCEACWLKVLVLFNLPVSVESTGERIMPDGRVFDAKGDDTGDTWDLALALKKARELGPAAVTRCPDNGLDHGRRVRCELDGGHDGPHQFVPWEAEA